VGRAKAKIVPLINAIAEEKQIEEVSKTREDLFWRDNLKIGQ